MNVREYLQQIKTLDSKIRQKEEQIEYLKNAAENAGAVRYDKDRVQVSLTDSKTEDIILKYMELEKEVEKEKLHLEQMRDVIISQIHELTDDRYINVLFRRYVRMQSYMDIALDMNYSYQYVRELHKEALEAFKSKHPTLSYI